MADWTDLIGPLFGTAGSVYASNQAANTATNAANAAAQAAQFRPVGVTTRFGKSGFNYDPTSGQLIGAGYQVAPDVAAAREGLMGMAGTAMGQAQQIQAYQPNVNAQAAGLFNLGASYTAQNPQQVAQNWLTQQQQLLAPGREQQLANLTNQQQQQGRLGLATGATRAGYTVNQPQSQGMMNTGMGGFGMPQMAMSPMSGGLGGVPQQGEYGNIPPEFLPTNKGSSYNTTTTSDMMGGRQGSAVPFGQAISQFMSSGQQQGSTAMPNYGAGTAQAPKTEADWNRYQEMALFTPGANMEQIKANFMSGGNKGSYTGPELGAMSAAGPSTMPQQSSMAMQPTGGQNYASQGLQATNPQMAAYYNAMAQQDAQLAAQAQLAGQQQVQFGQGLMTGGLNLAGQGFGLQTQALAPYSQYTQQAINLENQGLNALTQGSALGSAITAGSTNAANIQNQAAQQAAALQMQRNNAIVGGLTDPISQLISGLANSGGSSGGINYNAVVNPYFQTKP